MNRGIDRSIDQEKTEKSLNRARIDNQLPLDRNNSERSKWNLSKPDYVNNI